MNALFSWEMPAIALMFFIGSNLLALFTSILGTCSLKIQRYFFPRAPCTKSIDVPVVGIHRLKLNHLPFPRSKEQVELISLGKCPTVVPVFITFTT